mmetsp:Transcript_44524/g.88222  ORF Transcript_44524/g.88222 Transcript_44524/m.88222 type:complete len:218 (-) Transcript_44524:600-1253(-)
MPAVPLKAGAYHVSCGEQSPLRKQTHSEPAGHPCQHPRWTKHDEAPQLATATSQRPHGPPRGKCILCHWDRGRQTQHSIVAVPPPPTPIHYVQAEVLQAVAVMVALGDQQWIGRMPWQCRALKHRRSAPQAVDRGVAHRACYRYWRCAWHTRTRHDTACHRCPHRRGAKCAIAPRLAGLSCPRPSAPQGPRRNHFCWYQPLGRQPHTQQDGLIQLPN